LKHNDGVNNIQDFIEVLKEKGVKMNPTTPEDIEVLKKITNGKQLPDAYIEFYKYMGNGVSFFRGHSCFKNEIFILRAGAEELLKENNFPTELSENDFVFWMSQGYMFCFFRLDEGNDPPIYYYCEGKGLTNFYKIADSLSSFLYRFYSLDKDLFKSMNN
jgi:hypothetical protein